MRPAPDEHGERHEADPRRRGRPRHARAGRAAGSSDDAGYEIVACQSAEDALQASRDSDFDLVMTDVMLPGIDGYELADRLAPVPVLIDLRH